MVFLKVDYENNTATGVPKKIYMYIYICERESRRHISHGSYISDKTVHKPHNVEYGIIPKRFLELVGRA